VIRLSHFPVSAPPSTGISGNSAHVKLMVCDKRAAESQRPSECRKFLCSLLKPNDTRRPPCAELSAVVSQRRSVNFQVTVLKILVSYPRGHASMADLKRDMAILATSGREWSERTKRLAARVPNLDIFSQGLVERLDGGWRITDRGRAVLEVMEARPASEPPQAPETVRGTFHRTDGAHLALRNQRRQKRRRSRRAAAAKRTSPAQ
jgi:hypothetical protein